MHTHKTPNATFHHNGDYSGDIQIMVEPQMVESVFGKVQVTIPFKDLRALVFQYLRRKMVSELEDMSDKDLEESFTAV